MFIGGSHGGFRKLGSSGAGAPAEEMAADHDATAHRHIGGHSDHRNPGNSSQWPFLDGSRLRRRVPRFPAAAFLLCYLAIILDGERHENKHDASDPSKREPNIIADWRAEN